MSGSHGKPGRRTGARHARGGAWRQVAAGRGMARCDGVLLSARTENRGDGAAGAACNVWNMIESGDYTITDLVSEKSYQ